MRVDNALKRKLPRIACVGAEALTLSHGTGIMFGRHLANYPRTKVVDLHFQTFADQYLFRNMHVPRYNLNYAQWKDPWINALNSCLKGGSRPKGTSLIYDQHVFSPLQVDWDEIGGQPDLIYSTCYSAADFAFLHHVYRNLPKKVPIVQHFLDLDLRAYNNMISLYRELQPAIVALWTLTDPIRYAVEPFGIMKAEMVQALQQPLSKNYKKRHRKFSKDFRPVIIGNIWSGSAYQTLHSLWSSCQDKFDHLPPINWYGHPRRFHELKHMGITVRANDRIVRDAGFLSKQALNKSLMNADMGIVAFSGETIDRDEYTKYSLPSRIGDYCANGLPIVVISQKGTEPWRYVQDHGIGIALDPADMKKAKRDLSHFIFDRDWRAECGENARKFAERELDLKKYQSKLYPRLIELAQHEIPQQFLQKRFAP